ncbi:MAG: hypothetical protein KKB03_00145 [Nanoarchaeota archaeon]|nr:hypothetical protein [Nanoarchaeota archaeon]MBU1135797.1 hypothetical protein [Nanoarchaeota archaeon]MBU2519639.1 hypothetical protein [Nanoarchaeota archaeon]
MKLEGYENVHVVQRNKGSSSIPVGIEWMLRYKKMEIPDIESFQENFNTEVSDRLDNFENITKNIKGIYPKLSFNIINFPKGKGKEKVNEIEKIVKKGNPCLISIGLNKPFSSGTVFHTVPVVEVDEKTVKVLSMNADNIKDQVKSFDRKIIEKLHNNYSDCGGVLILK